MKHHDYISEITWRSAHTTDSSIGNHHLSLIFDTASGFHTVILLILLKLRFAMLLFQPLVEQTSIVVTNKDIHIVFTIFIRYIMFLGQDCSILKHFRVCSLKIHPVLLSVVGQKLLFW